MYDRQTAQTSQSQKTFKSVVPEKCAVFLDFCSPVVHHQSKLNQQK